MYMYINSLSTVLGYNMKTLEKNINGVVNGKNHLLSYNNIPFLVNACCNDDNKETNPLQFFVSEDKSIQEDTQKVLHVSTTLKSMSNIVKFKTLKTKRENITDRNPSELLEVSFQEKTIFRGLISLFNFDNSLRIPQHLQDFGIEKPMTLADSKEDDSSIKPNELYDKNMSLDEKIDILKLQNYSISDKQFIEILLKHHQHINKMNKNMNLENKIDIENETSSLTIDDSTVNLLLSGLEKIEYTIDSVDEKIDGLKGKILDYFIRLDDESSDKFNTIYEKINIDFLTEVGEILLSTKQV